MAEQKIYRFSKGPGEVDFFILGLARFQPVQFMVEQGCMKHPVIIKLTSAGLESGSGKSYIFTGWVKETNHPELEQQTITGYYSFHDRSGWMKILPERHLKIRIEDLNTGEIQETEILGHHITL